MNFEEIKAKILEIFESVRQSSNSDFDESHFLDYLISPPSKKDNIKNSFKGVKKYYNFFQAVEMEFGICFTLSDQDRFYSVDQFISKTQERLGKTRGNKMIIQRRMEEKDHYYIELFLTLIFIITVTYFQIHLLSLFSIVLYLLAIKWILGSKIKDRKHNKRLYKKIMNENYSQPKKNGKVRFTGLTG